MYHRQVRPWPGGGDGAIWLGAWAAIAVALVTSAFTIPLMGGPDEPSHTVKAVAVAHGEFDTDYEIVETGGAFASRSPTTWLRVPAGYGRLDAQVGCWAFDAGTPAACAPPLVRGSGDRTAGTHMGTYPPAYYLVSGLPSAVLAPRRAIYAMRLVSALLAAALLAMAVVSSRRSGAGPFLMVGLALAVTPTVVFLGGTVNPNVLEVAAAIALWCALLELVSLARPPTRGCVIRLATAAAALVVSRPLAPAMLVAMVGFVCVVLAEPAQVRTWWASRSLRTATCVVAACTALAIVYLAVSHSFSGFVEFELLQQRSAGEVLRASWTTTSHATEQMVGLLGWLGPGAVYLPSWALGAWLGLVALLFAAAAWLAPARAKIGVLLLVAGTVALPVISQLASRGVGWQGRHGLALAAGVPIVAGWALDRSLRVPVRVARPLAITAVSIIAIVQVVAHQRYMTRVVLGLPNGLFASLARGRWSGPLPPWVLLVGSVASAVGFGIVLLAPVQPDVEPTTAHG
jgi:hypothetical protein